jgi:hypothetical protein
LLPSVQRFAVGLKALPMVSSPNRATNKHHQSKKSLTVAYMATQRKKSFSAAARQDEDQEVADIRAGRVEPNDWTPLQRDLEGVVRDVVVELRRLEMVIMEAAKVLRHTQPLGEGMYDIRWWKQRGDDPVREPVLVRWERLGVTGKRGRPRKGEAALVVPRRVVRFKPLPPKGVGAAARNFPRMVRAVKTAQEAIKRRKRLLTALSSIRMTAMRNALNSSPWASDALVDMENLYQDALRNELDLSAFAILEDPEA